MENAFLDTSALFEYGVKTNNDTFEKVRSIILGANYKWYSSTYIFDELMTLLISRVPKESAVHYGAQLRQSTKIIWLHPTMEDEEASWKIFAEYKDKLWSFTDCLSYYLMKKNRIDRIVTFDAHFKQMGFTIV